MLYAYTNYKFYINKYHISIYTLKYFFIYNKEGKIPEWRKKLSNVVLTEVYSEYVPKNWNVSFRKKSG